MISHLKSNKNLIVGGEQIIKVKHRSGKDLILPRNDLMLHALNSGEVLASTVAVLFIMPEFCVDCPDFIIPSLFEFWVTCTIIFLLANDIYPF